VLNRYKLSEVLHKHADQLFVDYSQEYACIRESWNRVVGDPTFIYKVREIGNVPWPVAYWNGNISDAISVNAMSDPYVAGAVDGSQVYPDRHQNISCFLINIGSVALQYGTSDRSVYFDSIPYLMVNKEDQQSVSADLVNNRREELELKEICMLYRRILKEKIASSVILFDGSLIFWHLFTQGVELSRRFLAKYIKLLDQMYHEQVVVAGYISLPRSRELSNLIRLELCNFDFTKILPYKLVSCMLDRIVVQWFLEPYQRSIVFQNYGNMYTEYPPELSPYFFYMHTGSEIARVEIPAWIAKNESHVSLISRVILDQCIKGNGYPVVIAEAHEQAVIKGPDRDFFYYLLHKMSMEKKRHLVFSQKSKKKKRMEV